MENVWSVSYLTVDLVFAKSCDQIFKSYL